MCVCGLKQFSCKAFLGFGTIPFLYFKGISFKFVYFFKKLENSFKFLYFDENTLKFLFFGGEGGMMAGFI